MKIYLIPGLGADKRMYLPQLRLFADAEVLEHLPSSQGETLSEYAQRFIPFIDTRSPYILIGTSLGGMVAIELTGYIQPQKIILIASVKTRKELPLFIRSLKYLKFHKLLTGNGFKRFNNLAASRLDSRGNSSTADLIRQMIQEASPEFIEWAIDAVINWQPSVMCSEDVIHIHGTSDMLFPFSKIKNAVAIENGSHVMNMTMSNEVNQVLLRVVDENN